MTRYVPQWVQAGSYAASQDRRLINAIWPAPASSGCAVTTTGTTMSVNVAPGQVAVPSQNNTGSTLCTSDAQEAVGPLNAAHATLNRWDYIICRPRANDLDGGSNTDFIFDFVTGTPAASPSPPAVPAGTVAIGQIYIPAASAAITSPNVYNIAPGGLGMTPPSGAGSAPRGYVASLVGPATAVNCGASGAVVLTLNANVVGGRRYRLSAFANGAQQTAVGPTVYFQLGGPIDGGGVRFAQWPSLPVGAALVGCGVWLYSPTASGSQSWTFSGLANGGNLQVGANQAVMILEDIGSQ